MTKEDLYNKQVDSALGFKRIGDSMEYQVRARLIAKSAAKISIEYAISLLEEWQTDLVAKNDILPNSYIWCQINNKIGELKSLINQ